MMTLRDLRETNQDLEIVIEGKRKREVEAEVHLTSQREDTNEAQVDQTEVIDHQEEVVIVGEKVIVRIQRENTKTDQSDHLKI